jgi:thiosulfate reductase cytochrome b subunit
METILDKLERAVLRVARTIAFLCAWTLVLAVIGWITLCTVVGTWEWALRPLGRLIRGEI